MIEQITIKNFKSFRGVSVKLGPLNIFIGPNAGGKSNFFDALRVLQGIGYGFTLHEILDGKPKSATSEVWDGIRGGSEGVPFAREGENTRTSFAVEGGFPGDNNFAFRFAIAFSAVDGRFRDESLSLGGQAVYRCGHLGRPGEEFTVWFPGHKEGWSRSGEEPPALAEVARKGDLVINPDRGEAVRQVAHTLADIQRVDPAPALLREYSKAYEIKRMGERGENFAALVRMICSDPATKEAYLSWLRELRPREVDDVGVRKGAIGEPMFMMKEGEHEWLAPVLSDGTLRFAALAAAFFQPDMPGILTIEEVENGIHASRLRLLVELFRSRAAAGKTQVMVTTHSPLVLAWLTPEEYATTFYCKREEETGESRIVPLSEIPRFKEIIDTQPVSDLFAEGWMEAAL